MSARAALLALLAASAAHASYSLGGSLGGGCLFVNEWSAGTEYGASTFDFESDASFSGTPLRPGLLQLLAGARYRAYHSIYSQGTTTNQNYGFRVNVAGLNETALPTQLFASRDWGDFISRLGARQTGETTTTTLGASTQLNVRGYPTLRLSILRNILENKSFASPATTAGTTAVSVGAAYSTGTQTYNASYDTGWNSGTWAENNYRSHAVLVAASAAPVDGVLFRLSERYYLRLPTNDDPRNPRFDDNAFNVGLVRPSPVVNTGFDYAYRHVLVSAPQAPEMEQSSHGLNNATTAHLNPNTDLIGSAGVSTTSERLGTAQIGGDAEQAGLALNWRHKFSSLYSIAAGGGGSAGLSEPSTGGLLFGYGGSASLGASGAWSRVRGNATYTVVYQRNLAGVPGWTLSQRGSLNADTAFHGVVATGMLLATGTRRTDALLGTFVGNSLSLSLGASWKRFTGSASAGLSEGVSDALANPVATDGLFLPAAYNTHTVFATGTLGGTFDSGRLYVGLILRALSSAAPGRARQYENAAGLTASYTIGAFIFSLEERFSQGGLGTNWERGNLIMLRAMRNFSWGF